MKKPMPADGLSRGSVQSLLREARDEDIDRKMPDWNRRAFLFTFHADDEVWQLAEEAYLGFLKTEAIAGFAYPSVKRFQEDLIAFATDLLHGDDETAGTVTTGGTESIILAVRSARDWARARGLGGKTPSIVCPRPAHPAFNKAAALLGMRVIRVPEGSDYRADVAALADSVSDDTVMLVGSAPSLWHGAMDPIEQLAELALARNLWLHVDACLGGFIAPFVRKLGRPVPSFDLSIPGVRSIAADFHKYGYAPKGVSVVLFRGPEEARHHTFDWQDDYIHYTTPGLSGTRSGGPIAAAWAVVHYLGERGFLDRTASTMSARDTILAGIRSIKGLQTRGHPLLSVISFGSDQIDVRAIAAGMEERGWLPNLFGGPLSLQLRVTPAHESTAEKFVQDLRAAVKAVRRGEHPASGTDSIYTR